MAAGFEFELQGMDKLTYELQKWGDDLLIRADNAVAEVAASAVKNAELRVRVDEGDLQESTEAHRVSWGHQSVTAGKGLNYATRIEALDPFFRPSIEQARDDLRRRILRGLR